MNYTAFLKVIGVLIFTALFSAVILWMSKDVMPSSKLFEFKRLYEIAILQSKITPNDKADYYLSLLDQRLREMEVESNLPQNKILSTTYRYSATAGKLTDLIITTNLHDKVATTKKKFIQHKKILSQIVQKNMYGSAGLVNTSLDYLTINEKKLNDYQ